MRTSELAKLESERPPPPPGRKRKAAPDEVVRREVAQIFREAGAKVFRDDDGVLACRGERRICR